ncbi:hypothetical protein, partial [Escherichia coli]
MTNGISTSPHCLYKSNIVDDVIINKTCPLHTSPSQR